MKKQFGTVLNGRHYIYSQATSLDQMIPVFIRKVLEDMNQEQIERGGLTQALQVFHKEYAETLIENTISDNGSIQGSIICIEDSADHIMNQGWITENKKTVDNRLVSNMIYAYMSKIGIQDYDGKEYIKELQLV